MKFKKKQQRVLQYQVDGFKKWLCMWKLDLKDYDMIILLYWIEDEFTVSC